MPEEANGQGKILEEANKAPVSETREQRTWFANVKEQAKALPRKVLEKIAALQSPQKDSPPQDTAEFIEEHMVETPEGEKVYTTNRIEEVAVSPNEPISEPAPELEANPSSEVRDLFDENTMIEFSDKLKKSNGKAFFIVHPFFSLEQGRAGYVGDVTSGRESGSRERFWTELATILPKLKEANVPIVFLQELPYTGDNFTDDPKWTGKQYTELTKHLQEINKEVNQDQYLLTPKDFFVIYTERDRPRPARTKNEKDLTPKEIIERRMNALKAAGLKVGIVGGGDLKPSMGGDYDLYSSAYKEYTTKENQALYGDWNLKDYFHEKRAQSEHPHLLEKIRLDQCVGDFMRMLASADMQPAISRITYPDVVDVASNYEAVQYKGEETYKHTKQSPDERVRNYSEKKEQTERLTELQRQIASITAEFGIQPTENIRYDPYLAEGVYIGDNPQRVAEVQLEMLKAAALRKAEQMLTRDDFSIDRYDTQSGKSLTQDERLNLCRQRAEEKLSELRNKGVAIPESDPLTEQPVRHGSLRQLELTQ